MIALHILVAVLLTAPSALAAPMHQVHKHTKRSSISGRNIGTGFTIAISMILLAAIFFYLGMRRERAQSWRLWQPAPYSQPLPLPAPPSPHKHSLKNSISCPLAVSSSAPVHPVPNPVEAAEPTVRYLELPCKEVYEMGLPSPKRPLRATWLSLDRRPWWISFGERNDRGSVRASVRESSVRASTAPADSSRESRQTIIGKCGRVKSASPPPPAYPDAVYSNIVLDGGKQGKEKKGVEERSSNASSFMDWTGLEYVKRIYIGRKLSCRA